MARIVIEDLPSLEVLTTEEMEEIFGAGLKTRRLNFEGLEHRTMFSAVSVLPTFSLPQVAPKATVPALQAGVVAGNVSGVASSSAAQTAVGGAKAAAALAANAAPQGQVTNVSWSCNWPSNGLGAPSVGESMNFSFTVTSNKPGTPTGRIIVTDGGAVIAIVALGSGGKASFPTLPLQVAGANVLGVNYQSGNPSVVQSYAFNLPLTVKAAPTTLSVGGLNGETLVGGPWDQPPTLSAVVKVVAPSGGTPAGVVDFFDTTAIDPSEPLCSAPVGANGLASVRYPLDPGAYNIWAKFIPANNNFLPSTDSAGRNLVISTANPGISLVAPPKSVVAGTSLTFQGAVSPPASATILTIEPTGSVTLFIDGVPWGEPKDITSSNGNFSFGPYTFLNAGTYTIKALFYSSNTRLYNSVSVSETIVVTKPAAAKIPTDMGLLCSSVPTPNPGETVSFFGGVAPTNGSVGWPTGTVTLYVDGKSVGQCQVSPTQQQYSIDYKWPGGNHVITATFTDSDGFYANCSATFQGFF